MILALFVVVIIAIASSVFLNKKTVECLALSVFGITFILYLFSILNILIIGMVFVIIFSVLCIIYILYKLIAKKEKLFDYLDVGTLIFILLTILLYLIVKGSKIICYDEFTAWGMFVKTSFESKTLYIYSGLQALAKNYASSTSIFQIFLQFCNFKFSEDLLFIAMHLIYLSAAVNILKNLKLSNILEIFSRSCIILILPLCIYMWPAFYYTILVDVILGFVFAYILFVYFTSKKDKFLFLNISMAIFFLVCTKGNGLLLSLMALFIIYFDFIIFKKDMFFKYINFKKLKNMFKSLNYKNILIVLSPILIAVFTFFSWSICIKILGISSYSSKEINNIFSSIFNQDFYYKLKEFIIVPIQLLKEYKGFLLLFLSLAFSILMSNRNKIKKKNVRDFLIIFIIYLILNILYVFFLFFVCNTMVTITIAVEALRRYLLTLVAANLFLIIFLLIYVGDKKAKLYFSIVILIMLYVTTPASWQLRRFINKVYTAESIEYRNIYSVVDYKLKNIDPQKDVVYYINEIEGDIYLSNFSVSPIELSPMPTWDEGLTVEEYSSLLFNKSSIALFKINTIMEKEKLALKNNGNTYIYIYMLTDGSKARYSKLFEYNNLPMLNETLYSIENINNIISLKIIN